ncbi:hypothetical protein PCANC_13815 [Puccinia coronata f. sp. avenae]|uniref:Uncharacterized protein n=1 Tax=Puccinia coronata f. sp. avenae TaxID=200324 RepID=A0A2N5UD52_9BASI|nr:hypothetical protein PCANC_13815 [Puccinia coronata f. sp. avenae]
MGPLDLWLILLFNCHKRGSRLPLAWTGKQGLVFLILDELTIAGGFSATAAAPSSAAGAGSTSRENSRQDALPASEQKNISIGPPGPALRLLGDKISSTIVAQSARVPTMAWSSSSLSETKNSPQGYLTITDKVYKKACVTDVKVGLRISSTTAMLNTTPPVISGALLASGPHLIVSQDPLSYVSQVERIWRSAQDGQCTK